MCRFGVVRPRRCRHMGHEPSGSRLALWCKSDSRGEIFERCLFSFCCLVQNMLRAFSRGGKWFGTAVHNSKGMTSTELFCLRTTEQSKKKKKCPQSVDFFFYATKSELQYPMQSSTVVLTSENFTAAADIYLNSD